MRPSADTSPLADLANCILLVMVVLLSQACGGGGEAPCTSGSDCAASEMCVDGMCTTRPDAAVSDGGPNVDSGNTDAGSAVERIGGITALLHLPSRLARSGIQHPPTLLREFEL